MSKILKGCDIEAKLPKEGLPVLSALPHAGGVVRKEELKAGEKAQAIIEEARGEAKKIREEASRLKAQVEREMEKAKREGFEEGKKAGLERFTEALFKLKELKEQFFANAETEMIQMVLAMAEKVLGDVASKNKEAILAIVHQALERSLGDRIVIRLHPEDYKRIKDEEKTLKEKIEKTKHLYLKEDEGIQKGGCIVETEVGSIDAQLDTQLKAIKKALGV